MKAPPPERPLPPHATHAITSNFSRKAYEKAVTRVIGYIHAGDIFQANLSQRFETELGEGDTPYAMYLRLRAASPADGVWRRNSNRKPKQGRRAQAVKAASPARSPSDKRA